MWIFGLGSGLDGEPVLAIGAKFILSVGKYFMLALRVNTSMRAIGVVERREPEGGWQREKSLFNQIFTEVLIYLHDH